MGLITDNYNELFTLAKHTAVKTLGGHAGSDMSSWAEDIAQDVLVKLFEKESTLGDEDNIFGLVPLMVVRRCLNFKRDEGRRREIEQEHGDAINRNLDGSREALSADPLEVMAYEEMRSRLDELSPKLYNTVQAHYINGLSVREIAEEQEVTEDVIYKRLQRARDMVSGV
jgi:RNA polymerase sigma factor (sigma-70 family)